MVVFTSVMRRPGELIGLDARQNVAPPPGSLSLAAVVGIAIGGAVILVISTVVGVYFLRKHKAKLRELEAQQVEGKELGALVQDSQPCRSFMPTTPSVPFLPPHQVTEPIVLTTRRSYEDYPPIIRPKKKRLSPQKIFFKLSGGVRESWPLAASMQIPNSLRLPSHSTLTLNQVAPPGYLVHSEPRWPSRTYSRKTKSQVLVPSGRPSSRLFEEPPSPSSGPRNTIHRRAISETDLSTVLRSTSQRLKVSHRRDLSRTLTRITQKPAETSQIGVSKRTKVTSESREVLLDRRLSSESATSSYYEALLNLTPSPDKMVPRTAGRVHPRRGAMTPPSAGSDDSLCARASPPDFIIPSPLTSPSRTWGRMERHQSMCSSATDSRSTSSLLQKGCRASLHALGSTDLTIHEFPNNEISLPADPFYTGEKVSQPVFPIIELQNLSPRPLHIRKSMLDSEVGPKQGSGFASPLKDISGNNQSSPRSVQSAIQPPFGLSTDAAANPFQWSSQDPGGTRPSSASPKKADPNRKKGHKRSKVIRMSGLPNLSGVAMVPEEPEGETTISGSTAIETPTVQSPTTLTLLSRKISVKPPSSPTFNPRISYPVHLSRKVNEEKIGIQNCSPTLVGSNYYNDATSEDEFFKGSRSPRHTAIILHARRESSISPAASPTAKLADIIAYPVAANFSKANSPALSPNSEILRAVENRKTPPVPDSPTLPTAAAATLTTSAPIPGHLTGPRLQPRRYSSHKLPANGSGTLRESICMLRRMNSEVSIDSPSSMYSKGTSPKSSPVDSPKVLIQQPPSPSPLRSGGSRVSSRASQNYLGLGNSVRRQRVEKRESSRGHRDKRSRQSEQFSIIDSEAELAPVQEVTSSPPTTGDFFDSPVLPPPKPNNELFMPPKPTMKSIREARRLNNSSSPSRVFDVVPKLPPRNPRRESLIMLSPSSDADARKPAKIRDSKISVITKSIPGESEGKENATNKQGNRSPARSDGVSEGNTSPEDTVLPRLGAIVKVDYAEPDSGKKKVGWGWKMKRQPQNQGLPRPESMGLYDSDGFLRSSPERSGGWLEVGSR